MKTRMWAAGILVLALVLSAGPSQAAIHFVNLGTSAPPAAVGGVPVTPFNLAPQAAIPDFDTTSVIPGGPNGSQLNLSGPADKRTVSDSWSTWSHGFTGPVFFLLDLETVTISLPSGTRAFYLYVEPNNFDVFDVTATASDGSSSGPIPVSGSSGANGFAFFTDPGQSIVNVRVDVDPDADGFAIGEFGINLNGGSSVNVPTLSEWGMMLFVSLLILGALWQLSRRRVA